MDGYNRGGPRGGGGGFRSFAPVQVGEELDVKIEAVGEKGDGVAKKNGFVLFVPGTKQGDQVKVRVTKVLKKMAFAEVVGSGSKSSSDSESEGYSEDEDTADEDSEEGAESTDAGFDDNANGDSYDFGDEEDKN